MTQYIIIPLVVICLVFGGLAYWQWHDNISLEKEKVALEQTVTQAVADNNDLKATNNRLKSDNDYAQKLVAAVDEKQLKMNPVKQNAMEKVNNAPPPKCTVLPAAVIAAVDGMYDLRAAHNNTGSDR